MTLVIHDQAGQVIYLKGLAIFEAQIVESSVILDPCIPNSPLPLGLAEAPPAQLSVLNFVVKKV